MSTLTLNSTIAKLRVEAARATIGLAAIENEDRPKPEREPAAKPVPKAAVPKPCQADTPEKRGRKLRALLEERYPVAFPIGQGVPLARQIAQDVLAAVKKDGFDANDVNAFLAMWTGRGIYRAALRNDVVPVRIDGTPMLAQLERSKRDRALRERIRSGEAVRLNYNAHRHLCTWLRREGLLIDACAEPWSAPETVRAEIREANSLEPYESWLLETGTVDRLPELRGRGVACYCSTAHPFCHADLLTAEANKLMRCE